MARNLTVVVVADAAAYEAAMARAAESTTLLGDTAMKTGAKVEESSGMMAGAAKRAGEIFLAAFAVEKIAEFGKSMVEAGMSAEEQFGKLGVAMKNQGEALDKLRPAVDSLEASQRKLGFTNSDTRDSLTKFTSAGQDMTQATASMAEASDLARVKNESLGAATEQLIKVQAGNTRALKEFGIVLPPITAAQDALKASGEDLTTAVGKQELAQAKVNDKMATGAEAAQVLADRIKGQADEFSKSAEGGVKQLGAQFDALKETMGEKLLPVVEAVTSWLAEKLPAAADAVGSALSKIGSVASGAFDWLDKISNGNAVTVLEAMGVALGGVAVAFGVATVAGLAFAALTSPIVLVAAGAAALAAGFAILYERSSTVRDAVSALGRAFDDLTAKGNFGDNLIKALEDLGLSAGTATTVAVDLAKAFTVVKDAATAVWNYLKGIDWAQVWADAKVAFADAVKVIGDSLRIVWDLVQATVDIFQGKWPEAWSKLKDAAYLAFTDLIDLIQNYAMPALWALAQKIGEEVVRLIVAGLQKLGQLAWQELQALPEQLLRLDALVVSAAEAIGTKIVQEIIVGLRALGNLAWTELQALPQQLLRLDAALVSVATAVGTKVVQLIVQGLRTLASLAWTELQQLPAQIVRLDAAVVGVAAAAGKAVVSGIISGLSALAALAWGELQALPAQLQRLAGAVVAEAAAVGKIIVQSIVAGLAGLASAVWAALQVVPQTLTRLAGEVLAFGEDVGAAIMKGIENGIGSLEGAVVGKLNAVKDKIKAVATLGGLIGSDSPYFTEVGKAIMSGLANGMESNSKDAIAALKKTTDAAKQAMADAQPEIEAAGKLIGVKATEGIVGGIVGVQQTTGAQIKAALVAATANAAAEAALAPEIAAATKLVGQGAMDKVLAGFEGAQPTAKQTLKALIASTTAGASAEAALSPEIAAASNLLGAGTVQKIIDGVEGKQPTLKEAMRAALATASQQALADAKAAVVTAGQDFATAFGDIGNNIKTAFQNAAAGMPNPFRDALNKEQLADQAKQYQGAVDQAMQQLKDDTTSWAQKIADDRKAVNDAAAAGDLAAQQKAEQQLADDQQASAKALAADRDAIAAAKRAQQEYNLGLEADARDKANAADQAAAQEHLTKLLGLLQTSLPEQLKEWVKSHTDTSGEVAKFHAQNFLDHSTAFGKLLGLVQDELGKHNPEWIKVHEQILATVAKYEKPIADGATKNAKALNDSTDTELGKTKDVVGRNLDDARGVIDNQGDLWAGAGANLGSRLVDGLNSTVSAAGQAAGNIANKIAGFIKTGSPSKEGVFRMAPEVMGRKIAVDFARGLSTGVGGVNDALGGLSGPGGIGAPIGGGGGGGGVRGGGTTINVYASGIVGDEQQVIYKIRDGLTKIARLEPDIFGGRA